MGEKIKKQVSWEVFCWAMAFVFMVIGYLFQTQAALSSKVEDISHNNVEIQTQLSQIQTDIQWIKKALGGAE